MARCPTCGSHQGFWRDNERQPWCQHCRDAAKYRYYCVNRPPGYATIPDGWHDYEVWFPPRVPRDMTGARLSERDYYGWVQYTRRLDPEEVWKWDLIPTDDAENLAYWEWRDEQGR